ncbi:MAG: AMP-binding protein [Actinomycetota bacterium]|nr:AMP-binding protein [Actinomycetota bacterium]
MAVFAQVLPELDKQFGISVYANFGMTETVAQAISGRLGGLVARGSMGFPSPGYEMAVMDETTLAPVATGAVGELWLRGTRGVQLFLEYFDNPEANAASFTEDGWFRTGDLVSVAPGGNVVYADRHKDLIKVGGENVSALEVENVVRAVPGVAEVAVVARTHERLDMVAVAFVIPMPGAPENLEKQVIDACATQLSNFKVPRAVYIVDAFPRATLDKVTKNDLRDMAESMPAL